MMKKYHKELEELCELMRETFKADYEWSITEHFSKKRRGCKKMIALIPIQGTYRKTWPNKDSYVDYKIVMGWQNGSDTEEDMMKELRGWVRICVAFDHPDSTGRNWVHPYFKIK